MLEKRVVDKCCREVLEKSVGEGCWREIVGVSVDLYMFAFRFVGYC